MCGRILIEPRLVDLIAAFLIDELDVPDEAAPPRYNIAPTEPVLTLTVEGGRRWLRAARWGLIPPWWSKDKPPGHAFNARSEGVASSALFRGALSGGRCLVLASGFYEWRADPDGKQPLYIHRPDTPWLAFAGLNTSAPDGRRTATLLTCAASAAMNGVHDRMPVLLDEDARSDWLEGPREAALARLIPFEGPLTLTPVGRAVGNARDKSGSWLTAGRGGA